MAPDKITRYQQRITLMLAQHLPVITHPPQRLHEAMHYSVCNGGKRIRPLLIYATGEALDIEAEQLDILACAIEYIHAYSLIHDDLPAMDNDDLRRGLPTCHKAFDEATAILAGDALQSLAFEIIASAAAFSASQRLSMILCLAKAIGSQGMAGGQALDLAATNQALAIDELETVHRLKTGALIQASIELASLAAAEISAAEHQQLLIFAQRIGLAFQIQDDLLDIQSPTALLGKQQGADIARNKSTYPQLLGLETAKYRAQQLFSEALAALESFGSKAALLRLLAENMVYRQY